MRSIAVIGAGAAGLAAARRLQPLGHAVTLFDKGRRAGGRIASRETAQGSFDHGAQFLRMAEPDELAMLQRLAEAGHAARWPALKAAGKPAAWLGQPTMNALAQAWAEGLDLRCSLTVTAIRRSGHRWRLHWSDFDQQTFTAEFDAVLLTVPTPQALALLPDHVDAEPLRAPRYDACWTVLWTPEQPLPAGPPTAFGAPEGALAWLAREDLKPGRAGPPRLLLQASAAWTQAHLALDKDAAAEQLCAEAARRLGHADTAGWKLAHRWLYAFVQQPLGVPALPLAPGLVYASDACLGSRIELAMTAGRAAAELLAAA